MTDPDQVDTYAVLDVETTGLNPAHGDRAIEIGVVLVTADGFKIDQYSSLINPGFGVSSFISSFTGISNRMLATAPVACDVFPAVLNFIGDAHLVAHNASFDRKFWRRELKQAVELDCERNFICTLMLSRRIFQSFLSHKLGEIAQELAIDAAGSHRALADSQVTAKVLAVMLQRLRYEHSNMVIDARFLSAYQKRSRASLPDLTHVRHR